MMYNVLFAKEAQKQIEASVAYLDALTGSQASADALIDKIEEYVSRLKSNPFLFPLSKDPELAKRNYRIVLVKHYLLVFTVNNETVTIMGFFHQTQNYASKLLGD